MSWITVYIRGNDGFQKHVLSQIENNWLHGSEDVNHQLLLFWVRDLNELQDLKKAIGSKLIFKYRLRFFDNLEKFLVNKTQALSPAHLTDTEKGMLARMISPQQKTQPKVYEYYMN
jgi:hypothetical protein